MHYSIIYAYVLLYVSCNITQYYITSHHITSHHITSHHITSHIISYHIISYHIISYHIISYHIISYHIISYHIISYHISYHIIYILSYLSYRIISYHIISYQYNISEAWIFKDGDDRGETEEADWQTLVISQTARCPRVPQLLHSSALAVGPIFKRRL